MIREQSWITAMHLILDARLATLLSICINRLKLLICCKIFSHLTLITKRRKSWTYNYIVKWLYFNFTLRNLGGSSPEWFLLKNKTCFVCIMAQSSRFIWTKHKSKGKLSSFWLIENKHMITIWPLFGTLMQCTYHLFFTQSCCHVCFLFVNNL